MVKKLSSYIPLMEFLSHTYGPDYEIALHKFSDSESSAIHIINGHISGRTIG
ncbi:MAG: PAS domain-containing protein, partial [Anaerotignaceae bacterium]